ncbi:hypothetical protein M9Y10_034584 [Tritrichomonas musculus]|uniref:Protein kinase domain-containing protein n=1 Tax=Tritrichomonas musculus TaxID=1915356 RepID=A0ABR2KFC6_9EUKA
MEENHIGDYELFEMIGVGTFASVWVGCHRKTSCPVAVKKFSKKNMNQTQSDDTIQTIQREIMILKMFDHPFVADLFDVIETEDNIFLFMEYVEEGTLLEFVNKEGPINENNARKIFAQIVAVLDYLHNEKRIVHRDLKAENILLDRNHNIRVIDFGLSNVLNQNTSYLSTVCGSPAYVAPEMLLDRPYTQAADIWSAGVLLYAINASCLPFDDKNITRLIQKVLNDEPCYPSTFSNNLIDLIKKMLTKDPNNRITLEGIRKHPWFVTDGFGTVFNYDFSVLNKYKCTPDPNGFEANEEIVEKLVSFGIDCENLRQMIMANEMNNTTAAYRALLRDENTNIMEDLMNEMMSKATNRTMTFSSHYLPKRVLLKDLCPVNNSTDTQLNNRQASDMIRMPVMPSDRQTLTLSCVQNYNKAGSMPTINKIPSRGQHGMQLINLMVPTKSNMKTRTMNKPQIILYSHKK